MGGVERFPRGSLRKVMTEIAVVLGVARTPVAGAWGLRGGGHSRWLGAVFENMSSLTWFNITLSLFVRLVNVHCVCIHAHV